VESHQIGASSNRQRKVVPLFLARDEGETEGRFGTQFQGDGFGKRVYRATIEMFKELFKPKTRRGV